MTYSTPAFSPAADLRWEETSPGVRRTLVAYNDDLLLVKVAFEAGAVGALHQHVHSQISYVEYGEFEVTVGDDMRVLRTGDSFYAAPNVPHGVVARQAGALLDSFSPLRQDFLPAALPPA
ncbi:cupin domain-containing protein [Hymenobacter sp. HMF4947]|uniref:Cupin domain-containing protein n=1 Tax=Hymenobacter ginkgonis TaxID=2682976 RepID=A0A7K1TK03_9BACT|nr:cupin domain-containing protein [Hymenobacter ginkgonis]MVN78729.1 cupin domain-containing protein [Hymenobacter ginkgonis]